MAPSQGAASKTPKPKPTEMQKLMDEMNKRFDEMMNKMSDVELRITEQNEKFSQMETKIQTLEKRIEKLEQKSPQETRLYSSLFSGNETSVPINRATVAQAIRSEEKESEEKKQNIKITAPVLNDDKEEVEAIADELEIDLSGIKMSTKRVKREKKPDLLIVRVGPEKRSEFLKKAKHLRSSSIRQNTYISPDLTRAEEEQQYYLRQELKQKKKDEPQHEWIIRRGKVTQRL